MPAGASAARTTPVRHKVQVRTRRSVSARTPDARRAAAARRAEVRTSPRRAAPARRSRTASNPVGVASLPGAAVRSAVAVRDISESSLIKRMTRGRAWVAVLTTMLAGIVALNVYSVSLNVKASAAATAIDRLERENSAYRGEIAERLSSDQVEAAAPSLGMIVLDPTEVRYLNTSPDDAEQAALNLGYTR
jgi:hypothetical protein